MHSVANCNTVSNLIFKRFCSLYNRALSSSSYLVRFVYSKLLHSLTGYNHIYGHYNEFISSNDLFIAYFGIFMVYFLLVKTLVIYHAHSIIYCVLSIATDECGSSVGPGARKPSVGEGIQSRRLLVLTLFLLFFLSFLHLFLVCVSIIITWNMECYLKLLTRGLPVSIVRFLSSWYYAQQMCVHWNSSVSDSFHVLNGVRQGGVFSPMFFAVYVDSLLEMLEASGVGGYSGGCFVGAVCYADGIVLLAPCASALTVLLDICDTFSFSHGLVFNAAKNTANLLQTTLY